MLVDEARRIVHLVMHDNEQVLLRVVLCDVGVGEFLGFGHFVLYALRLWSNRKSGMWRSRNAEALVGSARREGGGVSGVIESGGEHEKHRIRRISGRCLPSRLI
jgi:hypothetical protein